MKIALFSAASLMLCSCASTQHIAPRFTAPSTTTIQKAHVEAESHVAKAKEIVKTLTISDPADQAKVDALTQELDETQDALAAAEGARDSLDTQLNTQTKQANVLADNYDKAGAQITSLQQSRHGWVKRFWIAAGLLAAAGIWIFRKPLMMAAGGFI